TVRPSTSADWPTTIRRTADAVGGDPAALQAELARVGAITEGEGGVRAVDLTHEGQQDLLVWYVDPGTPNPATRGNVVVLTRDADAWRPIFDATFGVGSTEGARLLEARDLNNDRQNELAYTLTQCGATGCSTNVRVGVWNGSAFRDLTVSEIRLPSLREAIFSDEDGNGLFDMVLTGGTLSSPAAGPQRERTDIYRWTPNGYALSETLYAASDWLPLIVWEANDALLASDYGRAITLYERAITDTTLRPWTGGTEEPALQESERALLYAFSRFRLLVANAALGRRTVAEEWLDALRTNHPDSPFRQAGETFMERWRGTSLAAPCRAVNDDAANNLPTLVDPLNNFGFTGPQFVAEDICPLG
ncbi:MAG: hypothetical protein ACRDIB_06730, partial [Ardenticatenaceae bacterium]